MSNQIQAEIRENSDFYTISGGRRLYIISHGVVTGGPFTEGEQINSQGNQSTAIIADVQDAYLVVTDIVNTVGTQAGFQEATTVTGQSSNATATITAFNNPGATSVSALLGFEWEGDIYKGKDFGLWMPSLAQLGAEGWKQSNDTMLVGDTDKPYESAWTGNGKTKIYKTESERRSYMLPVFGPGHSLGHALVPNTNGVTIIMIHKMEIDTDGWDVDLHLKTAQGGDVVYTVQYADEGVITNGLTVTYPDTEVVLSGAGHDGDENYVFIRIDWRSQEICTITPKRTVVTKLSDIMSQRSAIGFFTSAETEYGSTPEWFEISYGTTGNLAFNLYEVSIMDDPWLIIGDSLTQQMNAEASGSLLGNSISPSGAFLDMSQGSTGMVSTASNQFTSFYELSQNGLDKFRFYGVCCGTLGINDINDSIPLAGAAGTGWYLSFDAFQTTLSDTVQWLWSQIPPGSLAQASNAANLKAINTYTSSRVTFSPDLYTLMVDDDTADNVILKRKFRRAEDAGYTNAHQEPLIGASANIHLSRLGAQVAVATIKENMSISIQNRLNSSIGSINIQGKI